MTEKLKPLTQVAEEIGCSYAWLHGQIEKGAIRCAKREKPLAMTGDEAVAAKKYMGHVEYKPRGRARRKNRDEAKLRPKPIPRANIGESTVSIGELILEQEVSREKALEIIAMLV